VTLDVLLAGFGGLGAQDHQSAMYAPAFAAHPGFRIVGVAITHPGEAERARQAARDLSVPCHEDLDTALSTVDAPVVSVAAAAPVRAASLAAVLRAGRHVLADKPFAMTLAETRELAALADGTGSVTVAHHHRFHPMITAAVSTVRAGRIGLPWNVQADFVVAGGTPCPDGELLNFGCYAIDAVDALVGLAARRVHALPAGAGLTLLALDHDHGVTSTIVVGRTTGLAGLPPGRLIRHRYRISGSHGVLDVDATKPELTVASSSAVDRRWLATNTVDRLLDELYATVTTGRTSTVGLPQAVRTAEVLDAAQRAIATGVPVEIADAERRAG
jgi:predicted dehydrogenase